MHDETLPTFLFFSTPTSTAKWLSLIPVIGGVCLASAGELDFAWAALIAGLIANAFAAIKGNENKKAMDSEGLSVCGQLALQREPC